MTETLTNISSETQQEQDPFLFTPDAARARIESLGFSPDYVDQLLKVGAQGSSHELYALAVIAAQDEPKNINVVYHQLYPGEKQAETFDDVLASKAADQAADNGAWERFAHQ